MNRLLQFWKSVYPDAPHVYKTKPVRKLPPMLQEEVRTVVTLSVSGDNVILPAQNKFEVEVICVTLYNSGNGPIAATLKEKNFFVSPAWPIQAGSFATLAGKIIDRNHDLILNLSNTTTMLVQVRWIPYYGREYRPEWGLKIE